MTEWSTSVEKHFVSFCRYGSSDSISIDLMRVVAYSESLGSRGACLKVELDCGRDYEVACSGDGFHRVLKRAGWVSK